MNKFIITLMFSIIFKTFGLAQSQSNNNIRKQVWIDINPSYFVHSKLEIYGDVGARWEIENNGWIRMVLRPSIRVPIGNRIKLSTGLGNFFTINKIIDNRWEIRPFQGVSFNWPQWRIPISHYIRIEERFDLNTTTWNSLNSVRGRYQLGMSHSWGAIVDDRYWKVSAMGEIFYTFIGEQGQFQEQSRLTLGLDRSYRFNLHFRIEVTWQQEQLFYDTNRSASDIYFRFRYTYSWGDK